MAVAAAAADGRLLHLPDAAGEGYDADIDRSRRTAASAPGPKYYLQHLPFVLRCLATALLIVALARPQSTSKNTSSSTEGIDIVLALDISGSMLARDFQPDRISAAKEMAANFIMDRPNDRIGLVVFAGESFTQSPLTTDKASLVNILGTVKSGIIEDGTAIGNGLGTAVNRLRESSAKSKVVILLTDGVNNSGQIAPLTAARYRPNARHPCLHDRRRQRRDGSIPGARHVGQHQLRTDESRDRRKNADPNRRKNGRQIFPATDNNKLRDIYEEINQMEKSRVEVENVTRYYERFALFALAALALLVCEMLIRKLWLRQIP